MCGYLGQISNQKIDKSLLEQCNENIVCRGPDEKKAYFVDSSTQNSGITDLNIGFILKNLGEEFPIIFDSGIRSGSDILRALALGADFVMLGRPLMYAVGADGARGLRRLINLIKEELSTNLGLVGLTDINNIDEKIIAEKYLKDIKY